MKGFKNFINEAVNIGTEHEVLGMYRDARFSVRHISKVTGMSTASVYRVLRKYGLNPSRRNHEVQHNVIKHYYSTGLSPKKISELTGYSVRQIYNIITPRSAINIQSQ